MFFIYAYIQKLEAHRQTERAFEQEKNYQQMYYDLNKEIDKLKEELKNCR
jgi:hypothetical protein